MMLPLISCATTSSKIPKKCDLDMQYARVITISDLRVGKTELPYTYDRLLAMQEYNERSQDGEPIDSRQFEPVYASYYKLSKVDEQSLILNGGPDINYLLVLELPEPNILADTKIQILTTSFNITAKTDFVLINDAVRCRIERIYKIGDDEEADVLKKQLLRIPQNYFQPRKQKHI